MTKQGINNSAKNTVKKKKLLKLLKILIVIILILLIDIYIILWYRYNENSFTVYMDNEYEIEYNLVMYEDSTTKRVRNYLKADTFKDFSDTSIDWLPENLHQEADGSHNGNNYIAYTFYTENQGLETINYTAEIKMKDVIKNVDEAVRVIVYRNDQKTVYAKSSPETGEPETETVAFKDDTTIMSEKITNFQVGDIDKYTIVIFIEGKDKECTDALIGGEFEMYMTLKEEQLPDPEPQIKSNDESEDY